MNRPVCCFRGLGQQALASCSPRPTAATSALLAPNSLDYNPWFSADGKWVVFTSERGGSADIYRVHPDGSGLERLTDDPAFDDQAALSPDDSTLVFVSTREGGFANLWLEDLSSQGRRAKPIVKTDAGSFRPSWSPDGKWIAFASDRDRLKNFYLLRLYPLNGGEVVGVVVGRDAECGKAPSVSYAVEATCGIG